MAKEIRKILQQLPPEYREGATLLNDAVRSLRRLRKLPASLPQRLPTSTSTEDPRAQFDRELESYKEKIALLKAERTPEQDAQLISCYSLLLQHLDESRVFRQGAFLEVNSQTLPRIKGIFSYFLEESSKIPPIEVYRQPSGSVYGRWDYKSEPAIKPNEAIAIIERYGLLDGQIKSIAEVAAVLSRSTTRSRELVSWGLICLSKSPELKATLIVPKDQS